MPDGKNGLSNATSELEEQYLLKVLPPQYRIPMLPLGALTDKVVHVRYGMKAILKYWTHGPQIRSGSSFSRKEMVNTLLKCHPQGTFTPCPRIPARIAG